MAGAVGEDPFRRLPDELLHHVLSFLPEEDALQTCVVDTRWRDLWRSATSLDFDFSNYAPDIDWERFKQLVNLVIHLRGNSPLVKCEITSFLDDNEDDSRPWIEYALMCQVKELIVRSDDPDVDPLVMRYDENPLILHCDAPFISQHLKILEFSEVSFEGSSLDFSDCPVLEDLKMDNCRIHAPTIWSESLKRLCIADSCIFPQDFHLDIYAPDLILLELDDFHGLTPSLGDMPFLVTAYIRLGYGCHDFCKWNGWGCDNHDCGCHAYPMDEGVLLNGLSDAGSLELIAEPKMFVYRRDIKWCPIFKKLKTLLLNEWFGPDELVCILQHSPILEILTLQLGYTKNLIGATGGQETTEQSVVSAHLKLVNIECEEVDEGVQKNLRILRTCGILHDRISIKVPTLPLFL